MHSSTIFAVAALAIVPFMSTYAYEVTTLGAIRGADSVNFPNTADDGLTARLGNGDHSVLPNDTPYVILNESDSGISARQEGIAARQLRQATVWSGFGCTGTEFLDIAQFGCGGTCYTWNDGNAFSAGLGLSTAIALKKPTGSLFNIPICSGSSNSIGIESGHATGCTDNPNPGNSWESAFFFFDC